MVYLERLQKLTKAEMQIAVERTTEEWTESWKMPPLSFILERSIVPEEFHTRKFTSVADIDPERCPKGWSPEDVFRAHYTQEKLRDGARRPLPGDKGEFPSTETLGRNIGVSSEEIQSWLEAGKQKQRDHIARLEQDPKWMEAAKRFGVPNYRLTAEQRAAERNGRSTIPADPEVRKAWAHDKAVEMGWIEEREPGEEG